MPLVLFVLAVAVRWPHFALIPAPTDETDELLWALNVADGQLRPLTASDPYIGPACTYLTALAFTLAGPSFEIGRVVATLLGALVAPATWLLGYWLAGSAAGLIAGLVVAVAFGLVVMSHVAWSHGSAPALFAMGLALLARGCLPDESGRFAAGEASRRAVPLRLVAAGCCLSLAVAAHPTVACLLPGVAVWWLWQHRRAPPLAARRLGWLFGGAVAGYAPGLLFLAAQGPAPLRTALAHRDYVGRTASGLAEGVWLWSASLARNLAGPAVYDAADVRLWLAYGLIGLALVWPRLSRWPSSRPGEGSMRKQGGAALPLAVIASGALSMPWLLSAERFASLTGLRYAAPALPLAAVAFARMAAGLPARSRAAVVAGTLLVALATTFGFYRTTLTHGVTGGPILALVHGVATGRQAAAFQDQAPVLVESELEVKLVGGGEVGRATKALLELRRVPVMKARRDKIRWFAQHDETGALDMVLSADGVAALGHDVLLEPRQVVDVVPGQVSRSGPSWGWYRTHARRAP